MNQGPKVRSALNVLSPVRTALRTIFPLLGHKMFEVECWVGIRDGDGRVRWSLSRMEFVTGVSSGSSAQGMGI